MALPGHRRTSSHKRRRASHFALKKTGVTTCKKCKTTILPHHACSECGTYNGREAVDTSRDLTRALKRAQAKVSVEKTDTEAKEAKAEKSAEDKSSKA